MTGLLENLPARSVSEPLQANTLEIPLTNPPRRPAWIEIDLAQLKRNFQLINQDKPTRVQLLSVLKDEGYGHGALEISRVAVDCGVRFLGLSTLDEAIALREKGIKIPILLLGDRAESELPWCLSYDLTCSVSDSYTVRKLSQLAVQFGKRATVHLKINTGMNRYGVHWDQAAPLLEQIASSESLLLDGVLSHFAQSDEADKTFATLQLSRFNHVLRLLDQSTLNIRFRHLCNSGGFLDLPHAHFDMVRLGILPLGVYPSSVCRRIAGVESVMTVKAQIAAIQKLEPGDMVGYGMRFTAPSKRRIAVLPVGYGDGVPRVRNEGFALVHGRRAPIVGGIAMDALMVDITDIPEAELWDEAVLMGRQGNEEISVHEVAKLKRSVSYDVLTGWRARLPRIYKS